jgi:hypothetical protein
MLMMLLVLLAEIVVSVFAVKHRSNLSFVGVANFANVVDNLMLLE